MHNGAKFFSNLKYAFTAQLISLTLSVLLSLVVPKILDTEMYSYWQLFIFYSTYVNLFHFGISDGIYLRSGGKQYAALNHKLLGSQFYLAMSWQIVLACVILFASWFMGSDKDRIFVLVCVAMYIPADNGRAYLGMIFQAVNDTKKFSISVMLDNLLFIGYTVILFLIGTTSYRPLVIGYVISKYCGFIFIAYLGREIFWQKVQWNKETFEEANRNIRAGMPLMAAAFASNFIVGAARFIVDRAWGIEKFGKFSFSVSMTSFFLLFVRQVSIVLFPALKQESKENLKPLFYNIKTGLNLFLPLILLAYYPGAWILGLWLPQYKDSLVYLALLLPIVIFDSKTQMLFITYLKAFREERKILWINVAAVVLSFIFSGLGAYWFKNINFISISLVFVTAIRSVVMEVYISTKYFRDVRWKEILGEIVIVGVYLIIALGKNYLVAFAEYSICCSVYLFLNKKDVNHFYRSAISIVQKRIEQD